MGEDSSEKTEPPTPHKIREARKKGQVAKSQEFTSAIMLLASFYAFRLFGMDILNRIATHATMIFSLFEIEFSIALVGMILNASFQTIFLSLLPLMLVVFVVGVLTESLQTNFLFSFQALSPKLENLNPINGFKKFFALKQYVELIKSIIKIAAIIFILYFIVRDFYPIISATQHQPPLSLLLLIGQIVISTITRIGAVYLILSILDYAYQKYEYIKSLKMSKKEIKEEYKRLEGDPLVKQRQREAQYAMSQGRQMGQVPNADVVVTNPIHIAIAIKYDPKNAHSVPMVVAKGKRLVAEQIKQIADRHNIPIVENPPAAQMLFRVVEVGHYIPEDAFKIVAEILAFVFNIKTKTKQQDQPPPQGNIKKIFDRS